MPKPDPSAVWVERQSSRLIANYLPYFWTQNDGARKLRATAILKRMSRGDWRCKWCKGDLPIWRRADAQYCCEGCRKRAARNRRQQRVLRSRD